MDEIRNNVEEQYVNSAALRHSAYEVRIELFVESPNDDESGVVKKRVSDLRMSPQFAKELAHLLSFTVNSYEENVEKISGIENSQNEK